MIVQGEVIATGSLGAVGVPVMSRSFSAVCVLVVGKTRGGLSDDVRRMQARTRDAVSSNDPVRISVSRIANRWTAKLGRIPD
jgi:hypothetical protein